MPRQPYDIGIVGGGAAGLSALAGAARLGARTLLVERAGSLGGECLHSGCVPSKALLKAAAMRAASGRAEAYGLPQPRLDPVDLGPVMDYVAGVIRRVGLRDAPERFTRMGGEVVFGAARFLDPHTVEADGRRFGADRWIVATGSRPALPPVEGLADVPHLTNETLFSLRELPRRLLILGGGPSGIEFAQAFGRLGARVEVVEFLPQILPAEDPDMAEVVLARLAAEGVAARTATRALRAEARDGLVRLTVAPTAGGEETTLEADALLVAAGRAPNVEALDLGAAGVACGPKGITVDSRMRSNQRHIYACGDVNGQLALSHVAGYQASVAVTNAVLKLPRRADYACVPWCTYTDPEVASVGLNETRARKAGVAYRAFTEPFADNDRAEAEGETLGRIKVLVDRKDRCLGCQIVGGHAGEMIPEWALAMGRRLPLSAVAQAVHAYPTFSEISRRVAGKPYEEMLFGGRTKALLRLLFRYRGQR